MTEKESAITNDGRSYFDGTLLQLIGWSLLAFLVTMLTLGIAFPWACCWFLRWRTNHTVVEGKRLKFNGTGLGLIGNYILWWLLGLILGPLTLGIYWFWVYGIAVNKWVSKNTTFTEDQGTAEKIRTPIPVKTVVAIGIGAALMFVLMRFVAIPTGIPNVNVNLGIAILALFAAVFGPVAGFLIGFIGHTLVDLTWGWGVWWTWVVCSALFGLSIGLFRKLYPIEEGKFGLRQIVGFNIVQAVTNIVVWIGIAPTLDVLINQRPANLVYTQGVTVAAVNIASVLILGTLLAVGYTKTRTRAGSLKAE